MQLNTDKTDLKTELDNVRNEKNFLAAENERCNAEKTGFVTELDNVRKEMAVLVSENERCNAENAALKAKMARVSCSASSILKETEVGPVTEAESSTQVITQPLTKTEAIDETFTGEERHMSVLFTA